MREWGRRVAKDNLRVLDATNVFGALEGLCFLVLALIF